MPFNDFIKVETSLTSAPPPPPDTARTYAMVAPASPVGYTLKSYSTLGEMEDDGWSSSHVAYNAAGVLFSQSATSRAVGGLIVIPRAPAVAEVWNVDVSDATDGTVTLLAGGVVFSTFVASGNTLEQIKDGLIAGAAGSGYTGFSVDVDSMTVTNDNVGQPFALTSATTAATPPDVGLGPTVAAVGIYDDLQAASKLKKWWGTLAPAAEDFELDEARRWIQADITTRRGFLFAENDDPGVYDDLDTDNLAVLWQTAGYDRVNLLSHPNPTEYMAAAAVGRLGGGFPGIRAWSKVDLAGSTESAITANRTSAQTATMRARRISYTERMAAPTSPLELLWGATSGGGGDSTQFIYQRHAEDQWWFVVRAAVDAAMKSNEGVTLDDAGLVKLVDTVKAAMSPLITEGVLQPNYTIVPVPLELVPEGELAIGDYETTGGIIVSGNLTRMLRSLRVSAVFAL